MQTLFWYNWKRAPFLRILLPFVAGVLAQWYLQAAVVFWVSGLITSFFILLLLFYLPIFDNYRFRWCNGILLHFLFAALGGLLAWKNDTRNQPEWVGHQYRPGDTLIVTLLEPPVEKTNSYKIIAEAKRLLKQPANPAVTGRLILYLQKSDAVSHLQYGQQLIFHTPLQPIKNAGNPGGFNYVRYCLFEDITHQVFLRQDQYQLLPISDKKPLANVLFAIRKKVIHILRKYITGKKETGLAEALLIGYKDDLDKNLVQSYSNTGVVHIIAISGLHLGLVYWLLLLITRPLQKRKKWKWLLPVIIIISLWTFSLLAGGQPSVLRSAVMFSCIVWGKYIVRKSNIINTLALSAFLLLCYNPYWLWDVGFQLSYAAVLSIVLFMQPIYHWFCFENKVVDYIWKLNAVTLAAQILTVPVSIYHFHQFPNYFLLTNFIAVPLASVVLLGELLLVIISVIPLAAFWIGKLLTLLIFWLNSYIEHIESTAFSTWDNLLINLFQILLLLSAVTGASAWLLQKNKKGIPVMLAALLLFFALRSYSFYITGTQQKLIVYNVPKHRAMDIMHGHSSVFIGDSELLEDNFIRNFHLKPSRTLHRISDVKYQVIPKAFPFFEYNHRKILLVNDGTIIRKNPSGIPIDALIISGNPGLSIAAINKTIQIHQVIADASVPAGKRRRWQQDCKLLGIPFFDVAEQGAFEMNLN